MVSTRKGREQARKDFVHIRRVSQHRQDPREALFVGIKKFIAHNKQHYDEDFIKGYRAVMNHMWEREITGAAWRTPRIPGLKPRKVDENILARAYAFLEECNGRY